MWETIGGILGGLAVGAFGGWAKKNQKAKEVIDTLDTAADTAMTHAVDAMAAHVEMAAERMLDTIRRNAGPGTPVDNLQVASAAAIARGKAVAVTEFRQRMAQARAATIPRAKRDTSPETPAAMPPPTPPVGP